VESYLEHFPELQDDDEAAVDLIYGEVLLREERGETVSADEYLGRFPQYAAALRRQLDLHAALHASSLIEPTGTGSLSSSDTPNRRLPDSVAAIRHLGENVEDEISHGNDTMLPRIPGYEILGQLGRGGMGVVYEARQVGLNRIVALKMILAGAHAGPEELSRFRREAEALARFQHPHVVQIHEVGEHEGRPYFALEIVGGGSLAQKLNGTPQPGPQAAQLVETLSRTMHGAHEAGVIHRDLKPANILLAPSDPPHGVRLGSSPAEARHYEPKITDFGLAKRLDEETKQTQTGAVMGTPGYMAPEQALGKTQEIGPTTDVYALGAILYELLTGRPPFKGETVWDTVQQVAHEEPVPPRRLHSKVARDLETICLKCLRKEPRKRYVSAAALADDLQRFLRDEPIQARPVGPLERLWRWCRRNPRVASLAALLVLVVAGSFAALATLYLQAVDKSNEAQLERTRAEGQQRLSEARQKQAETEAAKANKIAQVLTQMFEASDPLGLNGVPLLRPRMGETLTAKELLDTGAERITKDLVQEPETQAQLMNTIGNVYCTLGLTAKAQPLLERALTLRRGLPEDHPDRAASLQSLAWLHHQTGDYDRAHDLYREALAIHRRHADSDPSALSATLLNLGWLLADREEFAAAEGLFKEALDLRLRYLAEDHRDVAMARVGLAAAYIAQGNFLAAVTPCRQAVETLRKVDGDKGLSRSVDFFQRGLLARELPPLARIPLGLADRQEAERCLQQSLVLAKGVLGDHHAYVALVLHELARTFEKNRRDDEAERYYRDCLSIAREYGLEHPKTTILLGNFCLLLQRRGKRAEAEQLLEEALEARIQRHGRNHFSVADVLLIHAQLLDRPTESSRRKQLLRESLAIHCGITGAPRRTLGTCLKRLAQDLGPEELYGVACELARSLALRGRETVEGLEYSGFAMEMLRHASVKGFRDLKRLGAEKDLDALRGRQDFQLLLGELEKK
jgi:serine/threonine protein kinase/Tfp pilus assembly protein PilF